MSAQANLVAFDGAATPLTHTFTAAGVYKDDVEGLVADYVEMLLSVPESARPTLTATKRKLKNGVTRVQIRLVLPSMETITNQNAAGYTAAPKVAFTDTHMYVGYFSDRTTAAQRRLGRQWLVNLLGGIATTVAPVIAGNIPELIDQNFFPS